MSGLSTWTRTGDLAPTGFSEGAMAWLMDAERAACGFYETPDGWTVRVAPDLERAHRLTVTASRGNRATKDLVCVKRDRFTAEDLEAWDPQRAWRHGT